MIRASLLPFVPLFAVLLWAAIQDVRTRRIRNQLTLVLLVAGMAQSFSPYGTVSPIGATIGLATGFSLGLALFLLGGMGGGDVKLLAGFGAWLGPTATVYTVAGAALIGMVVVLVNAVRDGQLSRLVRSTSALAANTLSVRHIGVQQAVKSSRAHVSIGRPLPYAVPVFAAAGIVVTLGVGG